MPNSSSEASHLLGRQVQVVDAELSRLAQNVVVDVGDVAHDAGLVAGVLQAPLEKVELQVHGGVPEVRRLIARDAARIHSHELARLQVQHPAARPCVS